MKAKYYKHPTAIVDEGAKIGIDTKIWHFCHIMSRAKIGSNCVLGQNVYVGGKAEIGIFFEWIVRDNKDRISHEESPGKFDFFQEYKFSPSLSNNVHKHKHAENAFISEIM